VIAAVMGKSPTIPSSAFIVESAAVLGDVTLGEHVSIWFQAVVRGDVHFVKIGDYTNVQDGCILHVTNKIAPLTIGARVTIGHKALLHGCTIGDDCLIGMGSIILDDVEVGAGSVVAAGALLPPGRKYPPASLILGSPAKAIRTITPKERADMIDQGWRNYHSYSQEYRQTFRVL
jgi:carbonic anhydrase/acetyltransferase-like protein (isoleucine patch superfamily)